MTMTATEIAQELVRIPSVNPAYDSASPGEGAVVDYYPHTARDRQ